MPRLSGHPALIALFALGVCLGATVTLRAADALANPNQRTHSIEQPPEPDTASSTPTTNTSHADAERSEAPAPAQRGAPAPPAATQPLDDTDVAENELLSLGESAHDTSGNNDTDSENDGSGLGGGGSWIFDTVTALGVVIGLILLLRWGYLKLSGQPSATRTASSVVEVLSRTTVAPRNHVLLLRVGHRILIVGDSGSGMRTLANIDDEQEVADLLASITAAQSNSVTKNFSQLLGRFGAAHDQVDPNDPNAAAHWAAHDDDGGDDAEHVFDRARHNVSGLTSRIRTLTDKRKGGGL